MPLSEFYRMAKGKMDDSLQTTTDLSYVPSNEFVELIWEDGQVMMQGQSKDKKTPVSNNFQFLTPSVQDREIGITSARTSKMGKVWGLESNQDDDMVPWLNYPIDDSLEQDYCSNPLPEISGVTLNESLKHHNFALMNKRGSCNPTVKDSQNVSSSKVMTPSFVSGASDIITGNTNNTPPVICGDSSGGVSQIKLQKPDSVTPCTNSNLLNFSHFSRPITMARADNKENGFHSQSNLVPSNVNSKLLVTKHVEESRSGEQSDTARVEDAIHKDKPPNVVVGSMTAKGLPESEKQNEAILGTSSVCSGNSVERVPNEPSSNLKRKCSDIEEFECQSEDVDERSVGVKRSGSCRGGTSTKRSRAAEVHNLSERRRRDRINEKMRALQELIPNCNKVDKASMLDEAIEYLKTLQIQVQIMSMGAGLCMPQMMFTAGMQHMPHFSHMGMGMGMGMGFGMGMVDMNGGSQGCPMIPPQRQYYPSPIPPLSSFQGIQPVSNFQLSGHPGQSIPMSGRSPMNPAASGLNVSTPTVSNVQVGNVASNSDSKKSTQNTDISNSLNQPSGQFQTKDEGVDPSTFPGKSGRAAADAGGDSAAAILTSSNDNLS